MDSLIVQIGVGGAFAVTILGMVFAFLIKFRVSDKQLVVQLAPGTRVMLDTECRERLFKTMENTTYLIKQNTDLNVMLREVVAWSAGSKDRSEAILAGLQENTRAINAIGLQIAQIGVRRE